MSADGTQTLTYPFPEPPGESEATEVAPGILWLRLPLPMALNHVNIYALDEGDGWTIIDAGIASRTSREIWEELACGVDEIALTARLESETPAENVMLVGHEPDLGELLAYFLTGRTSGFHTRVRKGSVSCMLAGGLPPSSVATLEWMMTAKQLGRIAD